MSYSEMLKEIIKESHWTQEQLAAKLGVSFATVNSWINGRTEPQKSLAPEIQKLYLAQDVTNEPEPVYVTLVNVEPGVRVGDYVVLEKDSENDYDDEAIRAYLMDDDREPVILENTEEEIDDAENTDWSDKIEAIKVYMGVSQTDGFPRPMHVANSVNTVVRGTRSAGRIYDKFDYKARAQVIFVAKTRAIAKIVSWSV
ncbi:helix-turn-helix transcriptional regulator [Candidatus Saccharibacteria bacterium]|nr:helix-turn-helix transcriptional regulator [Candidatus Saccharibacteria bacterium]